MREDMEEKEALRQQCAAQLAELEAISAALGTSEGHSSVTHILVLRQQLSDRDAEVAKWKRAFVTGGDETMRQQLASRDVEVANLAALGSSYLNRANAAELELDKAFEAGRVAEREDCAKLCDERYEELLEREIFEMAQAIRARSTK